MPTSAIMLNADGKAIKDAFERIVKSQIPNQRLLGVKNFYKKDTVDRIDNETAVNLTKRKNQIEEYIAASVLVHCSDGWTYISRAVESLINGDISSAIHFAYYAELRSAMSLMAYEGVGIFNRKHVWFDSNKNAALSAGRITTHNAVDQGMREWAKLPSKKDIIFKLIKVNNRSIAEWIRETGYSTRSGYTSTIINKWLNKWSIDIHLKDDQFLRNEMSYRPHFETTTIDTELLVAKLTDIWNVLEPTAASRFPLLDKYLLRFSIEEIFKKTTSTEPVGIPFRNFITGIFGRLGEDTTQVLFNFLIRDIEPNDHLIFNEAKKDRIDIDLNKSDPFPIICRAMLLLRLATGAGQELINESTLDTNNLRFWWEKISFEQGSTSAFPAGIDAIDLYTDIRESIDEINLLPSGSMSNIKEAFVNASGPLFYLKQFQRTAIWGMGL